MPAITLTRTINNIGGATADERARRIAALARRERDALIASGRASDRYETSVNGVRGAAEETIRPGGAIVYSFIPISRAVTFAVAFLIARSPPPSGRPPNARTGKTGSFRDTWMVSVAGAPPVLASSFDPAGIPAGAEVLIFNEQPYARKVDVQMIGPKKLHFSVPPLIIADAVKALRKEFGASIQARRVYNIDFPGQYRLKNPQFRGKTGRVVRKAGSLVETPALSIRAVR